MTDSAGAAGTTVVLARPPLSFLPKQLREPRRPLAAIGVGWATAFLPSIALAAIIQWGLPQTTKPTLAIDSYTAVLLLVVFAPVVETLIMAAVLGLLLLAVGPMAAILISSVGWGIAHSLVAPAWGLVIWWPFLVFSTLFVVWRKHSLLAALAIPASVHALQNLLPALVLASSPDLAG